MTIGLLLLSRLETDTGWLDVSVYMFVFGMGLGSVMQVIVIATQNAVDHSDLGAATSGVTYFRSMGGSFGTAIFGSVFSNRLSANIARHLAGTPLPAGVSSDSLSPDALSRLSPATHSAFVHAYADAIQTVFMAATPVAAFAFLVSWLLPELKLRTALAASRSSPPGSPGLQAASS
jgi:hypothetical protein